VEAKPVEKQDQAEDDENLEENRNGLAPLYQ